MENYTIFEEFELPSKGEIYEEEVSSKVKLRSMTVNEEMKRLAKSDKPYKVYADIIDACIVEPIGISSYDLCIGDFEYLLHKLRIVTYGPDYKISTHCSNCLHRQEDTIDLSRFEVVSNTKLIMDNLQFELPQTKKKVKINLQTPRMLDTAKIEADQFKKNLKDTSIGDSSIIFSLKSAINTIDGEPLSPINGTDIIRSLPLRDTNLILQKSQIVNSAIGINTQFEIVCDECGREYVPPFRITSEFFSPTI